MNDFCKKALFASDFFPPQIRISFFGPKGASDDIQWYVPQD